VELVDHEGGHLRLGLQEVDLEQEGGFPKSDVHHEERHVYEPHHQEDIFRDEVDVVDGVGAVYDHQSGLLGFQNVQDGKVLLLYLLGVEVEEHPLEEVGLVQSKIPCLQKEELCSH